MVKDSRHETMKYLKDTPTGGACPNGHAAVYRYNEKRGTMFIGCSEWPTCTFSKSLDGDWKRRSETKATRRKQEDNPPDEFICTGGYSLED